LSALESESTNIGRHVPTAIAVNVGVGIPACVQLNRYVAVDQKAQGGIHKPDKVGRGCFIASVSDGSSLEKSFYRARNIVAGHGCVGIDARDIFGDTEGDGGIRCRSRRR
jgi:hypothetical protein